jgi:uncharacterized membrane protein
MSKIEESIEVEVPVTTAYNQWTQFEEFPRFMEDVDRIQQVDDTHTRWTVSYGGKTEEFDATITEQIPDTRVAWKSTSGPAHAGVVDFHRLSETRTQLMVAMDYETDGIGEKAADLMGVAKRRVKKSLEQFKELIESRGTESGAWRGEVSHQS